MNKCASTVFYKMMPMYILKYMDMHIIVIQMTQKITTYMVLFFVKFLKEAF